MTDKKKTSNYIGMWLNEDKNGNPYLGSAKADDGTKYFVFNDSKDSTIKNLCSVKEGEDIKTIGKLEKRSNDKGEFLVCGDYLVVENRFFEEGSKKPQYQIKLP